MSERPTTKLQTPEGKELELKVGISAGERNKIRSYFLDSKMLDKNGEIIIENLTGEASILGEKLTIEIVVVSYDGKTDGIFDLLSDSSPEEYDFVTMSAQKVIDAANLTKKK